MQEKTITVSFEEDKHNALKMYLEKKGVTIEQELTVALNFIYNETVPDDVRNFLKMMSRGEDVQQDAQPENEELSEDLGMTM